MEWIKCLETKETPGAIEQKLELIGSTAIEDKLQENVGQTIKDIKKKFHNIIHRLPLTF